MFYVITEVSQFVHEKPLNCFVCFTSTETGFRLGMDKSSIFRMLKNDGCSSVNGCNGRRLKNVRLHKFKNLEFDYEKLVETDMGMMGSPDMFPQILKVFEERQERQRKKACL